MACLVDENPTTKCRFEPPYAPVVFRSTEAHLQIDLTPLLNATAEDREAIHNFTRPQQLTVPFRYTRNGATRRGLATCDYQGWSHYGTWVLSARDLPFFRAQIDAVYPELP